MAENEGYEISELDKDVGPRGNTEPTIRERPLAEEREKSTSKSDFKVYSIRWGILLTVAFLNISNASLWINNSPEATTIASYYERETEAINWFSIIYLVVAIPGAFYGTYCVDKWGLKMVIWSGCLLNFIGAIIRAIATSNLVVDINTQFIIAIIGQVPCALAQNFILYLHTKVSQIWFAEDQRGLATTILSMSNPMGVVVTEISVPFIIDSEDDVPMNDKIWLCLAGVTVIVTFLFVRRAAPKTPPSLSVSSTNESRPPYLTQLKMAFTTVPFLLLVLSLGGGVAFTIVIATVTQQILCPLGYSAEFSGFINGLMLLCGFVGAGFCGVLLDKTKMYTEITIYLFGFAAVIGIILFEFLMVPHREAAIATFSGLFGLFGVALFPVGLELAVEATYPVEESITTAFIFLSGQFQAIIIIILVPLLSREKSDVSLSVCDLDGGSEPKDYTVSIIVIMIFLGAISVTSIAFFKTDYKRQNAELQRASKMAEQQLASLTNDSTISNNDTSEVLPV